MEGIDYWRLCDEFNIFQATLLILGEDPSDYYSIERKAIGYRPIGYEATKTALTNSINNKSLSADFFYDMEESAFESCVNWDKTTIHRCNLEIWLESRGFIDGFFFQNQKSNSPDYLDGKNPNYSPKLAAAVKAWESVNATPELTKAKSVKQAILIWLRTHAGSYGLIKDDGMPNESGIEEVAKVANWETKGGAPKTP